jgi:hypothetical protein
MPSFLCVDDRHLSFGGIQILGGGAGATHLLAASEVRRTLSA